jgi:hypothetical protein
MTTCYLHIGTGKTGSSAIQYALTKAHSELMDLGYSYPDCSRNFRQVLAGIPTAGNGRTIGVHLRRGDLRAAIDAIRDTTGNLILSNEALANRDVDTLRKFSDELRSLGYKVSGLVLFRPQVDVLVSSYLQGTKAARVEGTLSEHVERQFTPRTLEKRWNYFKRAEHFATVFDALTVRWYPALKRQGPSGVVEAAFGWLGVPFKRAWLPDGETINPSPGREALAVLQTLNAEGRGGKLVADAFLKKAQAIGLLGHPVTLDRDTAERIHKATLQSNRALLSKHCPELSADNELILPLCNDAFDIQILSELQKMAGTIALRDHAEHHHA